MAGTAFLNKGLILTAVRTGLQEGIDASGERVATEARRRAPIRKVFKEPKGLRRKFRALSDQERTQTIERAEQYYGTPKGSHPRYYIRGAEVARRGSNNAPGASRKNRLLGYRVRGQFKSTSGAFPTRRGGYEPGERLGKLLTSRGKYEVRTGRAIHLSLTNSGASSRVQIGGALKASIGSEVTQTPTGVKARVSAAIRYAKFVEFPTSHNAAQPFLLPALMQERGKVTHEIATAIRRRLGG